MRSPRHCAPGEFAWTARYRSASPRRRANQRRHRAAATDQSSFQHLNSVAQIGRELELLSLDRSTQPLAQLPECRGAFDRFVFRRSVGFAYVLCAPVNASQQLAHGVLEGRVATRTSPPARRPEVGHGGVAEHAAAAVDARERSLLLHRLKEVTQRVLRGWRTRLNAILGCTTL